MAGGGGGGEGEPEFQIAPMIDVLLVLLIFFMSITTAQVLKVDKSIKLPIAPDALKKDSTRARGDRERALGSRRRRRPPTSMDDKIYPETDRTGEGARGREESRRDASVTKAANPTFRAVIRGDRDATAISVSRAMNAAAEAGISDISFSAVNKD